MNYRHAFHAGNFADVLKHALLVRVMLHLRKKEAAFRVLDTHAGAGVYDLSDDAAERTGEWRDGIGRVVADPPSGEAGTLLEPYLALVRSHNTDDRMRFYPGSPVIALGLARSQDRLAFCELHPEERERLIQNVGQDPRAKVHAIDGWTALKAQLPPPERRGLVLTDPPFEDAEELARIAQGLAEAHRRWATGTYLIWYPVKDPEAIHQFARRVAALGIPEILRIELSIGDNPEGRLSACGMLIVNPPWTLEQEFRTILPYLAKVLARSGQGRYRLVPLGR